MRFSTLVFRGLRFYWRSHLGVFLGTAVAAAVLTGALLVGDSVRHALATNAAARLGRVSLALESGSRFLAESLADTLGGELDMPTAPLLQAKAVASSRGEDGRIAAAAGVTLVGADDRFWRLAPPGAAAVTLPAGNEVLVSKRAARELGISAGDIVTLRIGRYGILPFDAPLSSRANKLARLGSFTVADVLSDEGFGRFSLRAEQMPAANIFIHLKRLQEMLDLPGKVNVVLVAERGGNESRLSDHDADKALSEVFGIGDAGYLLHTFNEDGGVQLGSERIFIDPAVGEAALAVPGASGSFTWLVDSLAGMGEGMPASTPYSFVAAASPSFAPGVSPVPAAMRDDEIILNRWTADELGVGKGGVVRVEYRVPDYAGGYLRRSRTFKIHEVIDTGVAAVERSLVPVFPGLTDVDTCRDWDIGLPLEEEKVLDSRNESYWRSWRQTPKAFVTLRAGREMWSTRWGNLTGIRLPGGRDGAAPALTDISVDPALLGYRFRDVAGAADRAVQDSVDFGGLFLGMSFFIIAAALALTAMLHSLAIQRRSEEAGLLSAVGFSPRRVTSLFLAEGAAVSFLGAGAGALLGTIYTRALLWGLGGHWQSAVAEAVIRYHREDSTLFVGAAAAFVTSAAAVVLTSGLQGRSPSRKLLALSPATEEPPALSVRYARLSAAALFVGPVSAFAVIIHSLRSPDSDPAASFFAAGALLLLSFLVFLHRLFSLAGRTGGRGLSPIRFALANAARRRWRSLGVAGVFACGCFIVIAVSSMKYNPLETGSGVPPGTGGFNFYGESVLPLLSDRLPEEVDAVPVKVRDGDDASCFNLNRAQAPKLLGVDPDDFLARGAFVIDEEAPVWELLNLDLPEGIVPGLAGDGDTALWNLGVKTGAEEGSELLYHDVRGGEFRVRLVGALPVRKSIFQGTVLISREAFTRLFPAEDGYRILLFDQPEAGAQTAAALEERYSQLGLDVGAAAGRLAEYYAVENTYLEMFLFLGGLGLALAVCGVGVVALRNIEERRTEHALLGAVGISPGLLGRVLVAEHAILFAAGFLGGALAGFISVLPALRAQGRQLPLADLSVLTGLLIVSGVLVIILVVRVGTARYPLQSLRKGEY